MVRVIAALQFLTVFPPIIKRPFTARELGQSAGFYPLIGIVLGGSMVGIASLLRSWFPEQVILLLVMIIWVVSTRALHIDGFMDSCDGLFGGFTPERRLEIMSDSSVGAFGAAGGVLLLVSKYILLTSQNNLMVSLLLAPAFGRWVLTFGIIGFPYARETGMGKDIKENAGWLQLIIATFIVLISAWAVAGLPGLVIFLVVAITSFLFFTYVITKIPGLTGDVYGAGCELAELIVMLILIPMVV